MRISILISALLLGSVLLMAAGSAPCYRIASILCCSAQNIATSGTVNCSNKEGERWSCPIPAPVRNEKVRWCASVAKGEDGRTECVNQGIGGVVRNCDYTEVTCGTTPGSCIQTPKSKQCKSKTLSGADCTGS